MAKYLNSEAAKAEETDTRVDELEKQVQNLQGVANALSAQLAEYASEIAMLKVNNRILQAKLDGATGNLDG